MTRLNQIIAIEKGTKTKTTRDLTDAHHALQKQALLSGIARSYQPLDEERGEKLPSETTKVQVRASDLLKNATEALAELFDITATKDVANCKAQADVVVDGKTLLTNVPVTTLLFLEKQLTDIHTFVKKLPVLDPADDWHFDATNDCYATAPTLTVRTKKVPKSFEKAPATDKHPAQVEMWHEDIQVGTWKTVKFSGALPQQRVNELLDRVEKLQKAVKFAREEANNQVTEEVQIGKQVFGYLLGQTN